jgi:hypothetical protein
MINLAGKFFPAPVTRAAFYKIIMQYSCKSYNMVVYIILKVAKYNEKSSAAIIIAG